MEKRLLLALLLSIVISGFNRKQMTENIKRNNKVIHVSENYTWNNHNTNYISYYDNSYIGATETELVNDIDKVRGMYVYDTEEPCHPLRFYEGGEDK